MYGGAAGQYPMYGTGAGGMITGGAAAAAAFYPYLNFGEGNTGGGGATNYTGQGYGLQYPHHQHHLFQYSAINSAGGYPQYGTPISLPATPPLQSGLYITTTFTYIDVL